MFDSALFYSRSAYAEQANKIIRSQEVQNLISIIRKYSDTRRDVQEVLALIDDKFVAK
jgi:hypothetical protein